MGGCRLRVIVATVGMALGVGLLSTATAAAAAPAWRIVALSNTTAEPGGTLDYLVQVTNDGDAASDGSPLDLVATLPIGVTAVSTANASADTSFSCTGPGGSTVAGAPAVTCTQTGVVPAQGFRTLRLTVEIAPNSADSVASSFQVAGGGLASASTVDPTSIGFASPSFGIEAIDSQITDSSGNPLAQAAWHPDLLSTAIDFNTVTNPDPPFGLAWPVEPTKNVVIDLPAGLIANPIALGECTETELANAQGAEPEPLCPTTSQVGTILVRRNDLPGPLVLGPLPLFNMVPAADEQARFAFNVAGTVVPLDAQLRSGPDYGLTLHAAVPQGLVLAGMSLTLWGVPSDPSHDLERGCAGQPNPWRGGPTCASGAPRRAFLRNPTYCTNAGLETTMSADSWTQPGVFERATVVTHEPPAYPAPSRDWGPELGMAGCDVVPFTPSLRAAPASTAQAGQPLAFTFDLDLPQSSDPDVPGQADLRWAGLALPEDVRVSPAGTNGFAGCSSAQIGLGTADEPTCPDASKVGSATLSTPLLAQPLTGSVYLATPDDNPFGSPLAVYLVAKGPGLILKLPWAVEEDPDTGDLTAISDDFPQLPLSSLQLEISGGPHGWMTLPDACGTFTTYALAASWSGRAVESESSFSVSEGAGGGPCPTPPRVRPPHTPSGTPRSGPVAPGGRRTPQAGVASVGRTRVRGGVVLVPLACSGGSGCSIVATLSVVERVRGGRVVGIAARKHRLRSKVGVVGRASIDLAAGQRKTLRVGPNRLGRRLLRRFEKLGATLRVVQEGKTVKTRRLRLG